LNVNAERPARRSGPTFMKNKLVCGVMLMAGGVLAEAVEWPHIMGPNLNRKTQDAVPASWSGGKPKKLWALPVEGGFGSLVTGDGRVYTTIQEKGREATIAVERKTGKIVWKAAMGRAGRRCLRAARSSWLGEISTYMRSTRPRGRWRGSTIS